MTPVTDHLERRDAGILPGVAPNVRSARVQAALEEATTRHSEARGRVPRVLETHG